MLRFSLNRLFGISIQFTNSFSTVAHENSELNRLISHIYRKTFNKKQLIEYIKDNVVFESERYIVTSLPQGVALKRTSQWADTVQTSSCETDLNEVMKELPVVFNTESLFLIIYPKSNASGLTVFAKSYTDRTILKSNLASSNNYNFSFLAVVLGCPERSFSQTFGVKESKIGEKYCTEILQNLKKSEKVKKVCYRHKVLASSPFASLVKVEVTQIVRESVRHILGTVCSTPVLGDIWNVKLKSSSLFGSSLLLDPAVADINSEPLNPVLLQKLNLLPSDESLIPIHLHLHSMNVEIKNKTQFFVSVPPPEGFVWTCNQLGFDEIKNYQKTE